MRKYQKIEKIAEKANLKLLPKEGMSTFQKEILEVLEARQKMRRFIDIDKARKEYSNLTDLTMSDTALLLTLFGVLDNAPTVEAIPKADYETRLKADLVAMLTELRQEIDIMSDSVVEGRTVTITSWSGMKKRICELIQSKINKLEESVDT